MNKWLPYIGIAVSVGLSYALIFTVPYAIGAIAVGIPLLLLSKKSSGILGFFIGFISAMSTYLMYPMSAFTELSKIISQLTSMPSFLIVVIFPLMYGIIACVSALLFTGLRERFILLGEAESTA